MHVPHNDGTPGGRHGSECKQSCRTRTRPARQLFGMVQKIARKMAFVVYFTPDRLHLHELSGRCHRGIHGGANCKQLGIKGLVGRSAASFRIGRRGFDPRQFHGHDRPARRGTYCGTPFDFRGAKIYDSGYNGAV